MVAKAVWTNAQFGTIKDIPELSNYTSRLQVSLPSTPAVPQDQKSHLLTQIE